VKRNLMRFFDPVWARDRVEQRAACRFATLKSVVRAFNKRATGAMLPEDPATGSPATADRKNDNPSSVP
jgi:hypothetical protein